MSLQAVGDRLLLQVVHFLISEFFRTQRVHIFVVEPLRLWTWVHDAELLVVLAILRYHRLVQLFCIPSLPIVIVVNSSDILYQRIVRNIAVDDLWLRTLKIPSDIELVVYVLSELPVFLLLNMLLLIRFVLQPCIFNLVCYFLVLNCIHQRFIFVTLNSSFDFDAYSYICLIRGTSFTAFFSLLFLRIEG